MIRLSCLIILTILTFNSVSGQGKKDTCDCPKTQFAGVTADTIFYLTNGKIFVLCGYKNIDQKPTTFSEFILAVCGQDSIIDFWGAMLTCRLKVKKDTLIVEQLENLPIGKNFVFQEAVWTIEKIYFNGQNLIRKILVNRQIHKYNNSEILTVLKAFETAQPTIDGKTMEIANKLFIATISGNKTARLYFVTFETKFGTLDGAFAEEYDDLTSMLNLWDKTNK